MRPAAPKGSTRRGATYDAMWRGALRARADLVTIDLTTPRTAGSGPSIDTAVFAATGTRRRTLPLVPLA